MGPIYSLADFLDLLRRRVRLILVVILAGWLLSVFLALFNPQVYQSSEVIQVKQPEISDDLARSTVNGSSARRLQLIEQQVMARSRLIEFIDELGLYKDLAALKMSEKVDLLRRSATITGMPAAREGFADDGTISVLTITAEMGTPELARDVAHAIANEMRTLAADQRREQTRETLEFFQDQENALLAEIAAQEVALANFRSENDISVEGSLDFRRAELGSLNDAMLDLDREIITAQISLQNLDGSGNTRAATVQREDEELTRLLDGLSTQRQLLDRRRVALSASIETLPEVERALAEFESRMTQLSDQYEVISTRRNAAEVGFTLETAASGERFITLEEAQVPDYPVGMSRKNRGLLGLGASLVLSLVIAFSMELRRPVLRTAAQMHRETGLMPIVVIPETPRPKERKGLSKLWQDRRDAGLHGRASRLARNPDAGRD
jgi:uncharacterized protein involved in exopolysaccharide biosynthesis